MILPMEIADFKLTGELATFTPRLALERTEPGLYFLHLVIESPKAAAPPALRVTWKIPILDMQGTWNPAVSFSRGLNVGWAGSLMSRATTQAPVVCLFSAHGRNRFTFAGSDALNAIELHTGVHEETANMDCAVSLFREANGVGSLSRYEITIRLDTRDMPFQESLGEVSAWWARQPGYTPSPVPETARLPMYSTWYSFHQVLDPQAVEDECRRARELGCAAVIEDDGWQTLDSNRGYAFCGDWQPLRMGDMKAHVDRIHALGMKFLLWYSVPFVGKNSVAFKRFSGKALTYNHGLHAAVLDPRYPDVREYLINTYETAMRQWGLDGFKLDFVDCFAPSADTPGFTTGMDYASVLEAADRLLSDVMARLRAINPEVMIEFRQGYVGPLMRKYGNMFRASDCPNDALSNRVRTIDVRLLCGNTAAHADMIMWHDKEPVESAALQFLAILFSVPQISVRLDKVPAEHVAMLRFYLKFWRDHRDVLLDGKLEPFSPQMLYPVIRATNNGRCVIAVYDSSAAQIGSASLKELCVVNATRAGKVVIDISHPLGSRSIQICDCMGKIMHTEQREVPIGVHAFNIPPAGMAMFR